MKIVKEFILRDIAGECVLVPVGETTQEFNGLITMTDTAKFIWENLEKATSREELIKMILDEYEIDEIIVKKDVIGFTEQLLNAGFVKLSDEEKGW